MRKTISLWQFIGFIFTATVGILLHYLYEWTGKGVITATFSSINESTWEHMKLLFFPLFIFAIIENRYFKEYDNFWCIKLIGTVVGLILIPTIFYTYNGVFGKSPDWVNISIFFTVASDVFLLENYLFKKVNVRCMKPKLAIGILCAIAALFVVFTFRTPNIPIFKDPITGRYGLNC